MLQLLIPNNQDYAILEDRVKSLLIPSEVLVDMRSGKPQLKDDAKQIEGTKEINIYLDELEKFTKQWYACRCDMFP